MSISTNWYFAAGLLVVGIAVGSFVTHGIMESEIHSRDLTIANMKTAAAVDVSKQSQAALANLTEATKIVRAAAKSGQTDFSELSTQLAAIDRRYRNAKPTPLPAGCAPGDQRVQQLTEGAAAVDAAISGSVPRK